MIELKNISKTYRSKKGTSTKALVDISLKFDTKGMTFILGKSGSGKSTLLNILGGLDKYDSGDMIILNKSSKEFTQADLDSYRNTYIGFVFQEFNILEDYDVYENIVLALQLQQKKVDEEEINGLLEKLELIDLKHRKLNELSGGQKQRVAIARALIKNPKIILADEPTGNLDSRTSHQVMDLLKEISKEKLVIVVSHDVESANTYGDRIIEIKDGTILRDTKDGKVAEEKSENYVPIKSHLPWKEGFKLGLGSIKHKKIKLVFTIILTVFSLLFLSITDTLSSYNINLAHSKLLKDKNMNWVQVEKYEPYDEDSSFYRTQLSFTEEEVKNIQNNIKQNTIPIYSFREYEYQYEDFYRVLHIDSSFGGISTSYGSYEFEVIESSDFAPIKKEKIIGRLPEKNDEILISNRIADAIIENGITIYQKEDFFFPDSYEDLLNTKNEFYFGDNKKVKIVGIIDYDNSKYQDVLEKSKHIEKLTNKDWTLYNEYMALENHIYTKVFVKEGFIDTLKNETRSTLSKNYRYKLTSNTVPFNSYFAGEGVELYFSNKDTEGKYYDGTSWKDLSSLKENEIVLSLETLEGFDYTTYSDGLESYTKRHKDLDYEQARREYIAIYLKEFNPVIGEKVNLTSTAVVDSKQKESFEDLTVVGVTMYGSYVPYAPFAKYADKTIQVSGILVEEENFDKIKELMDIYPLKGTFSLKSAYTADVTSVVNIIDVLKMIAFPVAIVFVVFTVILLTNFMFSSISYRKKEIGILRGLGAKSMDVTKIFIWEGIVLATISFIISSIALVVVTNLLNAIFMEEAIMILTPFIVTIRQFIVILLLVYLITILASILPILKISRMKPMDAILKK